MQVEEYLKSYKELRDNLVFSRNKMKGLQAISYSQEAKSSPLTNAMNECMAKIEEIETKMHAIENFVQGMFKGEIRTIVWKKYIDMISLKEIAVEHSFSVFYISKKIKNAIEDVQKDIKCQ